MLYNFLTFQGSDLTSELHRSQPNQAFMEWQNHAHKQRPHITWPTGSAVNVLVPGTTGLPQSHSSIPDRSEMFLLHKRGQYNCRQVVLMFWLIAVNVFSYSKVWTSLFVKLRSVVPRTEWWSRMSVLVLSTSGWSSPHRRCPEWTPEELPQALWETITGTFLKTGWCSGHFDSLFHNLFPRNTLCECLSH